MDEDIIKSDSILTSVKKLVGISEEETAFDLDILLNINAALSTLYQLGGLSKPFTVVSKYNTFDEMLPDATYDLINNVKMYLVYKTKLGFDTTGMTSAVISVTQELIKEMEWRLMTSVNPPDTYK